MWIKACVISFVIAAVFEPLLIPFLRKLKFGQTILEDGPSWHEKKQGTPTMGGIGFILSTTAASLLFVRSARGTGILLCGVLFGAIGFLDDYIKVIKKHNKGLSAGQKFSLQTVVSLAYALYLYFAFNQTETLLPFFGRSIDLGIFYIPFVMLVLLATSNSANLTDGLDGLAASVGTIVAVFFAAACHMLPGHGDGSIISAALAGGLLGFLIYNAYPAKVFMGDTGSMFIGGAVVGMAMLLRQPFLLLLIGFTCCMSSVSVILQRYYYKATRKIYGTPRRLFKMSPLHHHFEKCGMKETQIVLMYTVVTLVLTALAVISVIV